MVQRHRPQNQIRTWKIQSLSLMLKLEYKSFKIGKKIERDYCEDAIAVNPERNRFAVADGVSNSFRPEIVSQYLVDKFVNAELPVSDWQKALYTTVGKDLEQTWLEGVDNFLNGFKGFEREIQELRMQSLGSGASTFCGMILNIDNNTLDYAVLGDSCLFILPDEGKYEVVTSCASQEEENGWAIDFTSTTDCIQVGNYEPESEENWRIGSMPVHCGYIALMTDGASQWFQGVLASKDDNITKYLWNILDTPQKFIEFVQNSRINGSPLSDDIAILLVKITPIVEYHNQQPDMSIYTEEEKKPDDNVLKTFVNIIERFISKIFKHGT